MHLYLVYEWTEMSHDDFGTRINIKKLDCKYLKCQRNKNIMNTYVRYLKYIVAHLIYISSATQFTAKSTTVC